MRSLLTVLGVGVALRGAALARARVYFDEGHVLMLLREPLASRMECLTLFGLYPPGYFLVVGAAGGGETATRLASLAAGVLALLAYGAWARALVGPGVALVATLLLATSPLHVQVSVEARLYALELLLVVIALQMWTAAAREGGAARTVLCSAALAGAVMTGYVAALVGVALGVTWIATPGWTARRRALLALPLAAAACALIAWLARTGPHLAGPSSHFDLPRALAAGEVGARRTMNVLVALAAHNLPPVRGLGLRSVSALALAVLALGVVALARRLDGRGLLALLLPCVAVPAGALAILVPEQWGYGGVSRYAVVSLPAFLVVFASGLVEAWRARPARLLVALWAAILAASLAHTLSAAVAVEVWDDVAAVLRPRRAPGVPVVVWRPHSILPLLSQEPGFEASDPGLRLLPRMPYGRPVGPDAAANVFLVDAMHLRSIRMSVGAELAGLDVAPPFFVVLGPSARSGGMPARIFAGLVARHGEPEALVDRPGRNPALYLFGGQRRAAATGASP
jgi:hypothetical protein